MIARAGIAVLSLIAALALGFGPARAQLTAEPPSPRPADAESALAAGRGPSAPVYVGGTVVYRVRRAGDETSPLERAGAIRRRIDGAVADSRVPLDSLRFVTRANGVEVRLGPHFLWLASPEDLDVTRVDEMAVALVDLRQSLRAGIEKERQSRQPLRLALAFLFLILLTLAAWAAVRLLRLLFRHWRRFVDGVLVPRLPALRIRGFEILPQAQLGAAVSGLLGRLDLVVYVALAYAYLTAAFSLFPWTQGWGWLLLDFAWRRIVGFALAFGAAIPNLLTIAFIVILFRWLVALSDRFFAAVGRGTLPIGGMHPELALPSKRLARVLLWVVAAVVIYPYIPGSQTRAVQGVSLLFGLMISLGSTGLVSNAIAGLVLTYSRSFRPGERVRIGEHVGDVMALGLLATKMMTLRREEVTLPNGQVASGAIVNFSRLSAENGLVLQTTVTIGYDVEWRRVHELLIGAASRVDGVEREPGPWVFQSALNDFHVSYELNAVIREAARQRELLSQVHAEIQDAFAREGIEILSPGVTALRDANAPVLPEKPEGPRSAPGHFRRGPEGG